MSDDDDAWWNMALAAECRRKQRTRALLVGLFAPTLLILVLVLLAAL